MSDNCSPRTAVAPEVRSGGYVSLHRCPLIPVLQVNPVAACRHGHRPAGGDLSTVRGRDGLHGSSLPRREVLRYLSLPLRSPLRSPRRLWSGAVHTCGPVAICFLDNSTKHMGCSRGNDMRGGVWAGRESACGVSAAEASARSGAPQASVRIGLVRFVDRGCRAGEWGIVIRIGDCSSLLDAGRLRLLTATKETWGLR